MTKLNVGVLRGGPSREYDASLLSGACVLKHLPEHYNAQDIFISKNGVWHRDGVERTPDRALFGIDIVFNALHGEYGEDGKLQKLLDGMNMPYTGTGAMGSALGMNKILTKKALEQHGVKVPYHIVVAENDDLDERFKYIFQHFFLPIVVKPASGEGMHGLTVVEKFTDLVNALKHALSVCKTAVVEEFIRGKEAVCSVIDNFRGEKSYTTFPVEVCRKLGKEIHPGSFSPEEKIAIQRLARDVHNNLGLRHYSNIDMIVTPRRGIFVLEANTHPSLAADSTLHSSLDTVGSSLSEFYNHVLTLAQERK